MYKFSNSLTICETKFVKKFDLPYSDGPVMIHRSGCCEYRNVSILNLVFKGLRVVYIFKLKRDSNNTPPRIDKSKILIMILLSSFSLSVQLMKLS